MSEVAVAPAPAAEAEAPTPVAYRTTKAKTQLVGKARIAITACYSNGVPMMNEEVHLADVMTRKVNPCAGATIVAFTIPSKLESVVLEALRRGDVELLIEGIVPATEKQK